MSETGEDSPVTNFKRATAVQQERVESAETPTGFIDRIAGKYTRGRVEARYKEGIGGSVDTRITSGKANLNQHWNFDKDGNLFLVHVSKIYESKFETILVSEVKLERDANGRFQVKNETKFGSFQTNWEKDFSTAGKRIQTARNIPVTSPKPPQSQK